MALKTGSNPAINTKLDPFSILVSSKGFSRNDIFLPEEANIP